MEKYNRQAEKTHDREKKCSYCFAGCEMAYIQIPFVLSCSLPNHPFSSFSHKIGPQELKVSLMGGLTN